MTPIIGRPSCSNAISVPKSGLPQENARVPSIGSMTQVKSASARHYRVFTDNAMVGILAADRIPQGFSIDLSAMVTGELSAFTSIDGALRNH